MELLDDHDPEEARAILDSILERMIAAVDCYVGPINQVMGDGIMTLFGVPVAHEHHAVQVGYAAWWCVTHYSYSSGHGAVMGAMTEV